MIPIRLFNSIHFRLSILKQNPYKNEATKSMDNPVVNFKDVSGIAIVSQDGVRPSFGPKVLDGMYFV